MIATLIVLSALAAGFVLFYAVYCVGEVLDHSDTHIDTTDTQDTP